MSYVTVFTKVFSATGERPCVTTHAAKMPLKSHSNCSRNTIKILNYDFFPLLVKYLYNKRVHYRGGTTRGTDTAPEEYTGYPRGGSAAWILRFLSSVG